jgi:hypothetical protein
MIKSIKKIDLLDEWVRKTGMALKEVSLRERDLDGNIVFEVIMCDMPFEELIYINFKDRNKESVIYKYCWTREYEWESWAEDKEEECERLVEFYEQIKMLKTEVPEISIKEYDAIIEICESTIRNGNKLFLMTAY